MLDYDFVFQKGTLFIILRGNINKSTSNLFVDEINPLILDNGIKKVVLDVSDLKNIDRYGIIVLYNSYMTLTKESNIVIKGFPYYVQKIFNSLLKRREDEIYQ